MSWSGIFRRGEACLEVLRGRLATLPGVKRGFGKWSDANKRWTMNLDRIPGIVKLGAHEGVQGILLELPDSNLDNLCEREGWPKLLWGKLKRAKSNSSVAHGLLQELRRRNPAQRPAVERWRSLLRSPESRSSERDSWCHRLLPVPVPLERGGACLLSWSPCSTNLLEFGEALSSAPRGKVLAPEKQREYYLECILGDLHGVDVTDIRDPSKRDLVPRQQEIMEAEKAFIRVRGRLDSFAYP